MQKTTLQTLFIIATTSLSACSTSIGVRYIKTKDEPPITKKFTSAKAASTFYLSLFKTSTGSTSKSINGHLSIEIGPDTQVSDTKRINDAFRTADQNQNGFVSEAEAAGVTHHNNPAP